jgi:hypothetical protein
MGRKPRPLGLGIDRPNVDFWVALYASGILQLRSRLPTLWTNSWFVATVGGAPLAIIKRDRLEPNLGTRGRLEAYCRGMPGRLQLVWNGPTNTISRFYIGPESGAASIWEAQDLIGDSEKIIRGRSVCDESSKTQGEFDGGRGEPLFESADLGLAEMAEFM